MEFRGGFAEAWALELRSEGGVGVSQEKPGRGVGWGRAFCREERAGEAGKERLRVHAGLKGRCV